LVLDFITEVTEKSMAAATKKGRLHEKDLQWAIRKDRKKYARVKELLYMQEELKKARKGFEEAEMMRE
jgi:transcription initiation factor TFIID subunit 13